MPETDRIAKEYSGLRRLLASVLLDAWTRIDAMIEGDGRITDDPARWRDAEAAARWLTCGRRGAVTDCVEICEVLGIDHRKALAEVERRRVALQAAVDGDGQANTFEGKMSATERM